MSDQTPTDDTARAGDPRQPGEGAQGPAQDAYQPPDEGDDLLDALLRAAKAGGASDEQAGSPSWDGAELSFDESFEKRVREAARQLDTPEAPEETPEATPAEEEDNPLGVYAELDQSETPPPRDEEPR